MHARRFEKTHIQIWIHNTKAEYTNPNKEINKYEMPNVKIHKSKVDKSKVQKCRNAMLFGSREAGWPTHLGMEVGEPDQEPGSWLALSPFFISYVPQDSHSQASLTREAGSRDQEGTTLLHFS